MFLVHFGETEWGRMGHCPLSEVPSKVRHWPVRQESDWTFVEVPQLWARITEVLSAVLGPVQLSGGVDFSHSYQQYNSTPLYSSGFGENA